ncbi:MAG: hypothetical protein JJ863_05625 [Deltaproteobacteria bacterium]|nr:hypothetical protein [Deltaproteobacteria bacterium]
MTTEGTAERSIAEALTDDADAIRAQVDAVLSEELHWFPVRHHSPTVAHAVRDTIRARKPKLLFLEAPAEAQHLVPHLADSGTKPPIAIYSSFRDDDDVLGLRDPEDDRAEPTRIPSWYPMTHYSPELIAIRETLRAGGEVVFMDLPHWATMVRREGAIQEPTSGRTVPGRSALHELVGSRELSERMSRTAGHRTWDETWDTLFEQQRRGSSDAIEAYRRAIAVYCAAIRASTPPETLELDGTLPRERHMMATIDRELTERSVDPGDAMVVCGGFHLFLDRADTNAPTIPDGTVHTTLVPHSYPRLGQLSGYAAGNRAPAWYRRLFEGKDPDAILLEHVVAILGRARRKGMRLAAADTLAVVHHAHLLAQLRGRRVPILDDVHDAIITCCCKGDPALEGGRLFEAMHHVGTGTRVGQVAAGVGRLPLVRDFRSELERLELSELVEHDEVLKVDLDVREPADAERSALLHRLRHLGAPIGHLREKAGFGQTLFQEKWRLRWTPELEPALVEKSLLGDTVEAAATVQTREALDRLGHDAGGVARQLLDAVRMALPTLFRDAETQLGEAIDHDERFASLVDAFVALGHLGRRASYREGSDAELGVLRERAYARASFAIAGTVALPDEEQPAAIEGLEALADAILQEDALDADLFVTNVRSAADNTPSAYLRGAYLGILAEVRQLPVDDVADALAAHAHGPEEVQLEAGDFLGGVLAVSRATLMVGARALVAAVDEVLRAVQRETFLTMAPRMRAAIEELRETQKNLLADEVGRLYGESGDDIRQELSLSTEAAALLSELDAEAARIMDAWHLGRQR